MSFFTACMKFLLLLTRSNHLLTRSNHLDFWFTWFILDGGICGRGIVCPTVRHRHFSYNGYLGTWVWAVLASSVALAAALSSHCFWTFFIAASKKASDERFFAAALTFG